MHAGGIGGFKPMHGVTGRGVTEVFQDHESFVSGSTFFCYGQDLEPMTLDIGTLDRKEVQEQVVSGGQRLEDLDRRGVQPRWEQIRQQAGIFNLVTHPQGIGKHMKTHRRLPYALGVIDPVLDPWRK